MYLKSNQMLLYKLNNVKLSYSKKISCLFLSNNITSFSTILLPSFYFFKKASNYLAFLFLDKVIFSSFLTNIRLAINARLYFIKIRVRGLGYRYRSLCYNVHYFFFNYTILYIFSIH